METAVRAGATQASTLSHTRRGAVPAPPRPLRTLHSPAPEPSTMHIDHFVLGPEPS